AYEMSASLVGSEMCIRFFQAEDGIRDRSVSRGLGMCIRDRLTDPYKYSVTGYKNLSLIHI
ncbi:hypothetical protein, partial [Staphylococcus aureus]